MSDQSTKPNQNQNVKTFYAIFFILGFFAAFLIKMPFAFHSRYSMMDRDDMPMWKNFDNDNRKQTDVMPNTKMMSENLDGKTGPELEKAFLQEMIMHHEGAIDMAQKLKLGTNRPELLELSNNIIQAQTTEITKMKQWLKDWFNVQ